MTSPSVELAWNQEMGLPHYIVGRYYYDGTTLLRNQWAVGRDFGYDRVPITQDLSPTSRPVYVRFSDFKSAIFVTRSGRLYLLAGTEDPNAQREIFGVKEFRFPDLSRIHPGGDSLPELELPEFDPEILAELNRLADEEGSLQSSPLIQRRLAAESPIVQRRPRSAEGALQFEALLRRLYGLPVTIPPMISFEQARQLIQSGRVSNFKIDPLVQIWAEPPNRVVTLIDRDGLTHLVLARYLPDTNQIFPPT